jgi:tetratricopeptide (TPR) repeat protein
MHKNEDSDRKYIEALLMAVYYSPEMVDVKIKIADQYYQMKEFEKAVQFYEKVLASFPNREDILFKLAGVFEDMNKYDSAIVVYKRLSQIKPGDVRIINKINELKVKFLEWDIPLKFKNIFFKNSINREDLAALIGYYFDKHLLLESTPVIITDIADSFAKEYIIKVCSLGIMRLRPDHSFGVGNVPGSLIDRSRFAVVLDSLLKYLQRAGYKVNLVPAEVEMEAADILALHRHYETIKFLINVDLISLDEQNNFNPTKAVTPAEALVSLKKILSSIDQSAEDLD